MALWERLVDLVDGSGATVGVTDLAPFPEEEKRILDRVRNGFHGGLSFTYAHAHTASHPAESFAWARSIVVVAMPYLGEGDGMSDHRTVARFADGDRYENLMSVLERISTELRSWGHSTEVVFDDNRLIDRAVAIRAGVAWAGKSTLALTPGAGPWTLLGSVVTDAELPQTEPMQRTCGTCDACIPACPTDAIVSAGVLDAGRCISAVLQRRGSIARELRPLIGGRIYGCDDCLTACPPGLPALRIRDAEAPQLGAPDVLMLDDKGLESLVPHWYVPSRKMRFVRRNALVALGNTGDESSLDILSEYLDHDDELLAEHAAWAAGRIGGRRAMALCREALARTTSATVRLELNEAIDLCERREAYADGASRTLTVQPEDSSP